MFRQCAQLGIIAIGQTMVMLVAGLDLSVGGVIVMTSMVVAEVSNGRNEMIPAAIVVALIIGMLIGLGNGLLVTKRKVPPLVATLVMLFLVQGANRLSLAGCQADLFQRLWGLSINPGVSFDSTFDLDWSECCVSSDFKGTTYGRRIYATGSNPKQPDSQAFLSI